MSIPGEIHFSTSSAYIKILVAIEQFISCLGIAMKIW